MPSPGALRAAGFIEDEIREATGKQHGEIHIAEIIDAETGVAELVAALYIALPYIQRVAATAPTELGRMQRQFQAVRDLKIAHAALAKVQR